MPPNTAETNVPEDFTLEDLKGAISDEEMAALAASDDGIDLPFSLDDANDGTDGDAIIVVDQSEQGQQAQAKTEQPPAYQAVQVPDTTQAEANLEALQTKIEELATAYDEGELSRTEWITQQKALADEQAQALVVMRDANAVRQQNGMQRQQAFYAAQETFKAAGNEILWSEDHVGGWDAALRTVTGNAEYAKLPMDRQVQLAANFYAADYAARTGNALPISAGKAGTAALAKAAEKLTVKNGGEREEAPRTLGGMNGDANATMTDGALASLLRADPERAEEMFSRMTPDQQEQVLRMA